MNAPTHRRPKWTIGTMLLVVGWTSVVVWLNVRPRNYCIPQPAPHPFTKPTNYACYCYQICGFPWTHGRTLRGDHISTEPCLPPRSYPQKISSYLALKANIAIGLLAVAVLTWASTYLLRRMVSGLRAVFGKPPPNNEKSSPQANPEPQ
jgi:hypothetical protein